MCLYGTYKLVNVINRDQNKKRILVDACIADEIQDLNNNGIITLGCCCGHGAAGKIIEYENEFGKWRKHGEPPSVLISETSVELSKTLGYRPYPYLYDNDEYKGVWQMHLKSGCLTEDDCREWHYIHTIPYEKTWG